MSSRRSHISDASSSSFAASGLTPPLDRRALLARLRSDGPLGLGASPLGNLYQAIDDQRARATVDAAWDSGVRYFDTAPFYGFGLSERRLGDALRERPRDAFLLSTKVGRLLVPGEAEPGRNGFFSPMPFDARFDYSYDGIMRSFDASLQRLGLSRIDILLMHDIGALTHGPITNATLPMRLAAASRRWRLCGIRVPSRRSGSASMKSKCAPTRWIVPTSTFS